MEIDHILHKTIIQDKITLQEIDLEIIFHLELDEQTLMKHLTNLTEIETLAKIYLVRDHMTEKLLNLIKIIDEGMIMMKEILTEEEVETKNHIFPINTITVLLNSTIETRSLTPELKETTFQILETEEVFDLHNRISSNNFHLNSLHMVLVWSLISIIQITK